MVSQSARPVNQPPSFHNDDNLSKLVFMGNAPFSEDNPLDVNHHCVAYCLQSSTGWEVAIPGMWRGVPLRYSDVDVSSVAVIADDRVLLVPSDWCKQFSLFESKFGTCLDVALVTPSGKIDSHGNTMYVWQDYVVGSDPTDINSRFLVSITYADGIPRVSRTPNLNTNGIVRNYTLLGKTNLTDTVDWAPTNSAHRFFKVKVEMP